MTSGHSVTTEMANPVSNKLCWVCSAMIQGVPLSIEVFPGNTSDTKTFASQVHKVAERFGGGEVTFVGDRGMIKGLKFNFSKNTKITSTTFLP